MTKIICVECAGAPNLVTVLRVRIKERQNVLSRSRLGLDLLNSGEIHYFLIAEVPMEEKNNGELKGDNRPDCFASIDGISMSLPLHHEKEKVIGRKITTTSSSTNSAMSSSSSSSLPSMSPLLSSPSSRSKSSSSSSSPVNCNEFVVKSAIRLMWMVFRSLEFAISVAAFLCKTATATATANRRRRATKTKTVAIVGGNFAGLAALRELQMCWKKSNETRESTALRIVLIDKRGYSEYTPGILRLFCDPGYFFHLAQALPETMSDDDGDGNGDTCCSFERIQGTVTSIVKEDPAETTENKNPAGKMQNVLTYIPTVDGNPSDNNKINSNTDTDTDNNHDGALAAAAITPATKNLRYDYLILATGATYTEPISPATPKVAGRLNPLTTTTTMLGRYKEWQNVHERLKGAKRVLILGGGAVGVELAAEILDHNNTSSRTSVTIVDARPALVPLFPRSVGAYAEDWLTRRGAELLLGESLRSWNDRSCTMTDGTVVHADVVYVCFGNRPNSEMVTGSSESNINSNSKNNTTSNRLFSLTRRRNVIVNDTLQLVVNNDTDNDGDGDGDGDDNGYSDTPWFACGDVASPPTNDEKQAFQAEMQGKLAARNVIKLLESSSSSSSEATATNTNQDNKPNLLRYPSDIAGADRIPLVYVLSLGQYDGVLGFNDFCILGPLAAIVKWILEHTKVSQMRGRLFGNIIWKIGDAVTLFLSRTLFRSASPSTAVLSTRRTDGGARATRSKPVNSSHDRSAAISTIPASSSLVPPRHTPEPHQRHQYRELEEQLKLS